MILHLSLIRKKIENKDTFFFSADLLTTRLGILFLAGNSLFWFIRFIQQFIFLRVNNLKIHLLSVVFLIGTILFALPVLFK